MRRTILVVAPLLALSLPFPGCRGEDGRSATGSSGAAAEEAAPMASASSIGTPAQPAVVVPPRPVRLHGTNLATLPPKTPGVPRVLILGDSVAAGFGLRGRGVPYPDHLARRLAEEDGLAIEVLNGGVNGFNSFSARVLDDLSSLQPDVVVLELGGNDYMIGMPLEKTRENLAHLVGSARAMGARVLLVGVKLPADHLRFPRGRYFDGMYASLAEELGVPLVPDMYLDVLDVPRFIQRDRIHPTAEGQQVVAENILPALRALVREVLAEAPSEVPAH